MDSRQFYKRIFISLFAFLLIACGGSSDSSDDSNSNEATTNRPEVPTMPAPSFSSVGQQSEITTTIETADEAEVEDDGPNLALGERAYGNHCAECHGPNGEGGDATALISLSLEFSAFEDLLRTGSELGPEHLFGLQKISPGGLEALYGYLTQ